MVSSLYNPSANCPSISTNATRQFLPLRFLHRAPHSLCGFDPDRFEFRRGPQFLFEFRMRFELMAKLRGLPPYLRPQRSDPGEGQRGNGERQRNRGGKPHRRPPRDGCRYGPRKNLQIVNSMP